MKAMHLSEPPLEFGSGQHIDIRFGIMNYGPLDCGAPLAPRTIRLGIVGTPETIEGAWAWFDRCKSEIDAKESRQPHLFPRFPGFRTDCGFQSTPVTDARLQRTISERVFERLALASDANRIVREAAQLFYDELEQLAQEARTDVVVCAVPMVLLNALERETTPEDLEADGDTEEDPKALDFHHYLKARAMALRVPIQILRPSTYDDSKRPQQKRRSDRIRQSQDEATRAWNIHTALYYKAGGVPWRLVRNTSQLTTCFVGISFYQELDQSVLRTSIAQVFNERGDGVVVRGGKAQLSKDDRQPHLDQTDAATLVRKALDTYRAEHRTLPARVVLHKSSTYTDDELSGFMTAVDGMGIDSLDCTSLRSGFTKVFRPGEYPPLRGTLLILDKRHITLYTRGSVDFFRTYPGLYVPRPLEICCERVEQTQLYLAQEILALTKMNWNNTQFDGGAPITLRAARQVSSILKYVRDEEAVEPRYAFYM